MHRDIPPLQKCLPFNFITGYRARNLVYRHIAFMLFCHFKSCSGPNDYNELRIISHMDVTATAETSIGSFIGFHLTKTHLEGGNYYANTLLFSTCLHIAVILIFEYAYGRRSVTSVCGLVKYRSKRTVSETRLRALLATLTRPAGQISQTPN